MKPASLRELVELRGARDAERLFLTAPETGAVLTFGEYRTAVLELAAVLGGQGLERGSRVAVVLANGINAAVTLLGIIAAGGVAVPINPRLAEEEIARLLSHCGASLVITDRTLQHALPDEVRNGQSCDHDGPEAGNPSRILRLHGSKDKDSQGRQNTLPSWDDTALILYTSGTTGHPKGVVLSHGNLLSNAGYVIDAHRLSDADTALCVLPLFHINGFVVTLLGPLLSGGMVIMPRTFSADHFWHWLHNYRASWFSAVPTILSILLSHPSPYGKGQTPLRFARSASAPLPVAVLEEFERRFGIPVIETYGISEAACQVAANPLPPLARKPGAAGIPVGNDLRVVDARGNARPAGENGEVVIRGANVFKGYLDNPSADRDAFREGWFRTGDLGFLDQDGYLFLTGRKKELINRAGEKISPREVEEVIHRLPEVEAVGVVGVPHRLYGEEVAAFITLRQGRRLDGEKVRQFCREHLADFKTPKTVFFIEELPKGPSGKVQRRRLIEVYQRITSQKEKEIQA